MIRPGATMHAPVFLDFRGPSAEFQPHLTRRYNSVLGLSRDDYSPPNDDWSYSFVSYLAWSSKSEQFLYMTLTLRRHGACGRFFQSSILARSPEHTAVTADSRHSNTIRTKRDQRHSDHNLNTEKHVTWVETCRPQHRSGFPARTSLDSKEAQISQRACSRYQLYLQDGCNDHGIPVQSSSIALEDEREGHERQGPVLSTIPRLNLLHKVLHNVFSFVRVYGIILLSYLRRFWIPVICLVSVFLVIGIFLGSHQLLNAVAGSNLFFANFVMEFSSPENINTGPQSPREQNETDGRSQYQKSAQSLNANPHHSQDSPGTRKRSLSSRKNSRDNSNGDESDGDDQHLNDLKRQRLGDKKGKHMFACPFYKHNAQMYRSERACVGPGWNTVHRVKEHLYRRHRLPEHQCPRCRQRFAQEHDLNAHLRQDSLCVIQNQNSGCEGIDKDQAERLKSRKRFPPNMDEVEKWFEMYRIIFPNEKCPQNPYYDIETADQASQPTAVSTNSIILEQLGQSIERELLIELGDEASTPVYKKAISTAVQKAVFGEASRLIPQPSPDFESTTMEPDSILPIGADVGTVMIPTSGFENPDMQSYYTFGSLSEWNEEWHHNQNLDPIWDSTATATFNYMHGSSDETYDLPLGRSFVADPFQMDHDQNFRY